MCRIASALAVGGSRLFKSRWKSDCARVWYGIVLFGDLVFRSGSEANELSPVILDSLQSS